MSNRKRVLSIGLDRTLALRENASGDSLQRHLEYASRFDKFYIIVQTPPRSDEYGVREWSGSLYVYPTLSRGAAQTAWRMHALARELLQYNNFDIVSVQEPFLCGSVGYLLRKQYRIPLQVQLHSNLLDNPFWLAQRTRNRALNLLGRWVLHHADAVRTVNTTDATHIVERFGFPRQRVASIPVRVSVSLFEESDGSHFRSLFKEKGIDHIILFVGSFVKHKDLDTLMRMFAAVHSQLAGSQLIMIGEGEEQQAMESLARSLGVLDSIELVGRVPLQVVAEYMNAADVLVLSSQVEGFGRVLVEAAAAQLPVVATACSGPMDVVVDGKTGYLVPLRDYKAMAERVLSLLHNSDIAHQMGQQAHERIKQIFDPERLVRLNIDFLQQCAELGLRE